MEFLNCISSLAVGIIKYILCFFNFLVILVGIALVVTGVFLQSAFDEYHGEFEDYFDLQIVMIIVVGSIILVIGSCGVFGALISSRCLLIMYGVLMVCVIIAQVTVGIITLMKVDDAKNFVLEKLLTIFNEDFTDDQTSQLFDVIQNMLNCCGVNGPADYLPIFPNGTVPDSCCRPMDSYDGCSQSDSYKEGCLFLFSNFVSAFVSVVGGVVLGLAIVQLIPTAVGFSLAYRYRTPKPILVTQVIMTDVMMTDGVTTDGVTTDGMVPMDQWTPGHVDYQAHGNEMIVNEKITQTNSKEL